MEVMIAYIDVKKIGTGFKGQAQAWILMILNLLNFYYSNSRFFEDIVIEIWTKHMMKFSSWRSVRILDTIMKNEVIKRIVNKWKWK